MVVETGKLCLILSSYCQRAQNNTHMIYLTLDHTHNILSDLMKHTRMKQHTHIIYSNSHTHTHTDYNNRAEVEADTLMILQSF